MSDIAAFPTIRNVLIAGQNILDGEFKAGAAIKAGMVVAIHGTGEDYTVHPAVDGTTAAPIGVALYDAASGEPVAIAGPGCICRVALGTNDAIDAGHYLMQDNNTGSGAAEGGFVVEMDPAIGGHSASVVDFYLGYTIENSDANNEVVMMFWPGPCFTAS